MQYFSYNKEIKFRILFFQLEDILVEEVCHHWPNTNTNVLLKADIQIWVLQPTHTPNTSLLKHSQNFKFNFESFFKIFQNISMCLDYMYMCVAILSTKKFK